MVLYRSPEQTDLHIYCWSFSQVHCSKIFCINFIALHPPAPPPPPPPPSSGHVFFLMHHDDLIWILKESHQSYIKIGPVVSDKKIFKCFI